MAPTQSPEAATPLPGSKPKGKGKFLIIAVVVVIVLGGAGAAGYWMWAGSRAAANAEAEAEADGHDDATSDEPSKTSKKKKASENPGLVEFPGFLVNLADSGGQAYLRVTLSLLVADQEQAKLFEEKPALKSMFRSSILEVLTLQSGTVLVTPDGKAALKLAIIAKINALAQHVEVEDVLFSDFVVQY